MKSICLLILLSILPGMLHAGANASPGRLFNPPRQPEATNNAPPQVGSALIQRSDGLQRQWLAGKPEHPGEFILLKRKRPGPGSRTLTAGPASASRLASEAIQP